MPATFTGWPPGMRIIARRERPHPGAQLRITDHDGWRITCSPPTPAARRRWPTWKSATDCAPAPRTASAGLKDTGLTNLPLHDFDKNQIWLELVALAAELLTWTQTAGLARPPRPPLGTQTPTPAPTGRRRPTHHHRPPTHPPTTPRWPWTRLIRTGWTRLRAA